MAIVQISRIQQRRGLQQDLPQLAGGEFGWSVDERRLFIGNGSLIDGAYPGTAGGHTEVLTEYSDILNIAELYTFKGLSAGFTVQTGPDIAHPVRRTLQDKLDEVVSVKDFGAVGDGVTDDTEAIQRALDRAYSTNQIVLQTNWHRTIYFPAGVYVITDTIYIPPFSKLQGEGKRTTIIEGNFSGPLARFKDSFNQTGYNFGRPDLDDNYPDISEFHFGDLSFIHKSPTYDQSCLQIDGCWTATFTRCMFRGMAGLDEDNYTIYSTDRGTGVAGVCLNNISEQQAIRNIIFSQCDFVDHNYAIECNGLVIGLDVNACYFNRLYYGVVLGKDSSNPDYAGYYPYGFSVYDNYFRYSAAEAIYGASGVNNILSQGNLFTATGLGDWESDSPIDNPDGYAYTPGITFNDNNNYSIADSFDRGPNDYALYPNIETNGYRCYLVAQDRGIVDGTSTLGTGYIAELDSTGTMNTAGLVYYPRSGYTNAVVNYTATDSTNQRTGSLRISGIDGSFVYDEEYTETGDIGLVLQVNSSTGDVEYTATAPITFNYSLNYFN